MKLDKLLKKLKRDLAASPQKAGALGLMVLVALYFWAPLVMKFVGVKGQDKKVAASKVILGDDPILTKVAAHPASDTGRWDRVRQSMAQDQLMTAAVHHVEWENPFRRSIKANVGEKPKEPAKTTTPTKQPTETPKLDESAAKERLSRVIVSSVMISQRDRTALIAGTVYRVGDPIEVGEENGEPEMELRVISIDKAGIEVDYQGQKIRLDRPKRKLAPGNHIKSN